MSQHYIQIILFVDCKEDMVLWSFSFGKWSKETFVCMDKVKNWTYSNHILDSLTCMSSYIVGHFGNMDVFSKTSDFLWLEDKVVKNLLEI